MIRAIETQYKGYRFRSRLEARWAVFFDAMNIGWQYEPEGYEFNGERYLPDFLIDGTIFVEIKPEWIPELHVGKLDRFASITDKAFLLIIGVPGEETIFQFATIERITTFHVIQQKFEWLWCSAHEQCQGIHRSKWSDCKITAQAYGAARSARFEHGEKPRTGGRSKLIPKIGMYRDD